MSKLEYTIYSPANGQSVKVYASLADAIAHSRKHGTQAYCAASKVNIEQATKECTGWRPLLNDHSFWWRNGTKSWSVYMLSI